MRFPRSVQTILVLLSFVVLAHGQEIRNLSTDQRVLAGTEWRLIAIGPEGNLVPGTTVTLKFGTDGRASGSSGCNLYSGGYGAVGDTITFQRLISTRRACLDQNASQQERRFLAALEAANKFRLTANALTILSDRGQNTLSFVRVGESEPSDGRGDDRDDPVATLASYYSAINSRDYRRAFRYWENPTSSFEKFASGFADTDRVRVLIEPSTRIEGAAGSAFAEISTIVVATTRAGNERVFTGCYVMRRSNVQDRGWQIYRANLSQVPSSLRVSRMLSQVCN